MEDALSEDETRNKVLHWLMVSAGQVLSLYKLFLNSAVAT